MTASIVQRGRALPPEAGKECAMRSRSRPDRPFGHSLALIEEARTSLNDYVRLSSVVVAEHRRLSCESCVVLADSWRLLAEYRQRDEALGSRRKRRAPFAPGK